METRPSIQNSDKNSYFLPFYLKGWKLNSVVFLTSVAFVMLLAFSSGRSEALDTSILNSNPHLAAASAVSYLERKTSADKSAYVVRDVLADERTQSTRLDLDESNWHHYTVKHESDLTTLAAEAGLNMEDIHLLLSLGGNVGHLNNLYYGDKIHINISGDNKIMALEYDILDSKRLRVTRVSASGDHNVPYVVSVISRPLLVKTVQVAGVIDKTLYKAAIDAGLPKDKTKELVRIFDGSIDYSLDLKKGDTFAVVYEQRFRGNERVDDSPILAAEFVNDNKIYRAVRYAATNDKPRYYTPDGTSLHTTFLRSPMDHPLVSSGYNEAREHPILHIVKPHTGVDFAAKIGTPIKATADGFIRFKGRKGEYGKTVVIQHGRKISTLYAHMNSYARHLKHGDRVRQGDIIGYVGQTGLATGPHLHYEYRINGQHVDPMKVNHLAVTIPENRKHDFSAKAQLLLSQLKSTDEVKIAWNKSSQEVVGLN
ncbi:MAG: M23 family metallopeptidase [Gammaproteobacteria bacterium]|nr:M23 family metallopeptidase [Gammaproteobacteria bacterium]